MSDFQIRRKTWLESVASGCHDLAVQHQDNPDFYVFQSKSDIESPELLIIGANPGGNGKYASRTQRSYNDLGYNSNQYIDNADNPGWKINKPILNMFSEPNTYKVLENAVIMNVIYFNTAKVADLRNLPAGNEMITFCKAKTTEFIYDILKPKNILLLGVNAPKWMGIKFEKNINTVLETDDNQFLIQSKIVKNINHFLIYHPSMNYKFNTGNNLERKKDYFTKYFQ